MRLPIIISGFLVGICTSLITNFGFALAVLWLSSSLIVWFVIRTSSGKLAAIFLLAMALGSGRASTVRLAVSDLDHYLGQKITIEGVLVAPPDEREQTTRLILKPDNTESKILITAPPYPSFRYGDRVELTGTLTQPQNFLTDAEREFNYQSYLALDGIFYESKFAEIKKVGSGQGNPVKAFLFKTRELLLGQIETILAEPQSSLLGGILLGVKQSLGPELLSQFRRAGISHIIVLSGYNVTIVAEGLQRLLVFLPRAAGLSAGAIGIMLFAIMTGGGASIIRASIMALLVLLARGVGRIYSANRALLLASAVMIFHRPLILFYDVGFQLSVLATFAIINLAPRVEKRLSRVPEKFGLRGVVATTVATQLFVLPWLVYKIGELSLVALPVNVFVLPLIPITMLVGFVALLASLIHPIIALPFSITSHFLLSYQLLLARLAAVLPGAVVALPPFSILIPIFCYSGIAYLIYGWKRKTFSHPELASLVR